MRWLFFVILAGCTGEGLVSNTEFSDDAGSQNNTSANNVANNANNTVNPGNNTADDTGTPGSDMGADVAMDVAASPQDMGPTDFGMPVYQNACESGPLAEPIANCRPTPLPSTGDVREDCVRRVNQFRWECQCLPPLQRWRAGESCADQQAANDAQTGVPHGGFSGGVCSPRGFAQNECPRWGNWDAVIGGCLQQMWDEGPGEPFSAHGHYINMSNTNYSMVACGEGGGWFVQNFQ